MDTVKEVVSEVKEKVEKTVEPKKETVIPQSNPADDRSAYNCPDCKGEGLIRELNKICPTCNGTGKV